MPRLHIVEIAGEGVPIVFLHGLAGTHRYWQALEQTPFPPGRRIVLVDLLGFGDSPKPWSRYTVERHLQALQAALADRLGADAPVVLVGHSLGAVLALAYASRCPQQVRGLLLLSLPCFKNETAARRWVNSVRGGWVYTHMLTTALMCVLARRVLGPFLPHILSDLPHVVVEDMLKHHFMASTSSLWNGVYRHDVAADAHALPPTLPVIGVHGDKDSSAPFANIQELLATLPSWQLLVLTGVDHQPWLRDLKACQAALQRLLLQTD
ncbi:MAG: alpha/beta hydrolase [Betaproteobacteria bacterium]|nr:alpha/beta hydrolase [Betaproteobacteria bacterium]